MVSTVKKILDERAWGRRDDFRQGGLGSPLGGDVWVPVWMTRSWPRYDLGRGVLKGRKTTTVVYPDEGGKIPGLQGCRKSLGCCSYSTVIFFPPWARDQAPSPAHPGAWGPISWGSWRPRVTRHWVARAGELASWAETIWGSALPLQPSTFPDLRVEVLGARGSSWKVWKELVMLSNCFILHLPLLLLPLVFLSIRVFF